MSRLDYDRRSTRAQELHAEQETAKEEVLDALISWADNGGDRNSLELDGIHHLAERIGEIDTELTEMGER